MKFGQEMKVARKATTLTQLEAGVTIYEGSDNKIQTQMSWLENHDAFPTKKLYENCKELCNIYGIPIGVIVINSLSLEDFQIDGLNLTEESFNDMKHELQKVLESYITSC